MRPVDMHCKVDRLEKIQFVSTRESVTGHNYKLELRHRMSLSRDFGINSRESFLHNSTKSVLEYLKRKSEYSRDQNVRRTSCFVDKYVVIGSK